MDFPPSISLEKIKKVTFPRQLISSTRKSGAADVVKIGAYWYTLSYPSCLEGSQLKKAISISIGSSRRDKITRVDLLGQTVEIERRGTDGDMQAAKRLYTELDGQVDAFGVGGADLGLFVNGHFYPLPSIMDLVSNVKYTPIADGTGLKVTLESKAGRIVEEQLGSYLKHKRVLLAAGVDRWGMALSFAERGFDCQFGDMMFGLGIHWPLHSLQGVTRLAKVLIPIISHVPFEWLYPVGEAQHKRTPKFQKNFEWAEVIAGDCHYIRRYMPERLDGKIIVTNTTTPEDQAAFRQAGVAALVTTTPVLDGRSFGTNMMEAALAAASGRTTPIDYTNPDAYFATLAKQVEQVGLTPQVQIL